MLALPEYRDLLRPIAAASAQRNDIPFNGTGYGMASIEDGFPIETMKDIDTEDGVPPMGQDMNGLLNVATSPTVYLQQGGNGFKFSQEFVNRYQGYAQGAMLCFDDPTIPYWAMSTINHNTTNFNTSPESIGNQWALQSKIVQYNAAFRYFWGALHTHLGSAYLCVQENGVGTSLGVVEPGSNPDVWAPVLTSGGGGQGVIDGRIYVGKIDLLPNRINEMPPGWYPCIGTRYSPSTAVGVALINLSPTFRTDWGITLTADGINVPMLFSNGNGYFLRAVNGTTRAPGSVENASTNFSGLSASGSFTMQQSSPLYTSGAFYNSGVLGYAKYDGGDSTMTIYNVGMNIGSASGTETRPINIGMTPAIFLGV